MGKSYNRKKYGKVSDGYRGALLRMLPVVLMVAAVPLIMGQYKYSTGLTKYAWFGGKSISYDLYLGWKSLILTILAFLMIVCILVRLWREKRKVPFVKLFLPLFGYGLLAFISACGSVNTAFSFSGSFEQFESVWVLLSYVLVVYYVFLYAKSETELQVVADAVCFGSTVIGILGTLQGFGFDPLATSFFQKLITSDAVLNAAGGALNAEGTRTQAVATLYNPNYMGVYGSFVIPFLVIMLLFEKNKWRRLWHGCNTVLMLVALLFSGSRAGLIAAVAALCVAVVLAFHRVLKWWFLTVPAINLLIVVVLLVNAYSDNAIFDRLKNVFAKDEVKIEEVVAEDGTTVRKTGLTQMYTTKDGVAFTYNEKWVQVSMYKDETVFGFGGIDEAGEEVELIPNEDVTEFSFEHPALAEVKVYPVYIEGELGFRIKADGEWNFTFNQEEKKYLYVNRYGRESKMISADSFGFEERQRIFSGRGHLWSRTLPLLKDHVVLGSGPDTFVLEYPQEDYLMMRKNSFEGFVVTKPHSWYLQVGVQTGVLSLLCLLVFYGWYAVWSIRLYAFRKLTLQTEAFGIAAFIGSIGFMISGISNDSMVVTSPVFWGLMGLGVAANFMVKKNRQQV